MAKKIEVEAEVRSFVDKAEFDAFKASQEASQDKILDVLEKMSVEPKKVDVASFGVPKEETGAPSNMFDGEYLPPQYRAVFEKYFDPADGFTARLSFPEINDKGQETGGITFTIFVPLKFSNTDDAYRKMYKQDLRSRALQPSNIGKGIEEYCRIVARNLHYNRNLRTK